MRAGSGGRFPRACLYALSLDLAQQSAFGSGVELVVIAKDEHLDMFEHSDAATAAVAKAKSEKRVAAERARTLRTRTGVYTHKELRGWIYRLPLRCPLVCCSRHDSHRLTRPMHCR